MLIQKRLLEQLINMASDSAEYLNEKWITVKPHGADSKGTHVLVKDGETNKEAVDRKFDSKAKEKKEVNKPDNSKHIEKAVSQLKDIMSKEQISEFKGYLSEFDDLSKVNLDNLKEQFEKAGGAEKALSTLKSSVEWKKNYKAQTDNKNKFYDFIEKNDFKDERIYKISSFIDEKGLKPFNEIEKDLTFANKLGFKYISDKFSDKSLSEDAKIKNGYDILKSKMK